MTRWVSRLAAIALAFGLSLSTAAAAESRAGNAAVDTDLVNLELVRESVISTVKRLEEVYVYPEVARRVSETMIERLESGSYDHLTTRQEFAEHIGAELREISGDGHLSVMLVEAEKAPTHVLPETVDRFALNHAFEKVDVLEGNIGYLKFNKFYLDDEAVAVADHALGFLSSTDALIIDLTECVGGSPELVRHMLSYFFADETLLWQTINRDGESVYDALSTPGLGGSRFKSDFPLFILTSPETASAAELFTYTLRSYGKAKTVGQGTMGVAHAVGAVEINKHFYGRFATYRNANPVTGSDWEGVGLAPDTSAATEDSMDVAVRMAKAALEAQ